jgi:hypothetical protein
MWFKDLKDLEAAGYALRLLEWDRTKWSFQVAGRNYTVPANSLKLHPVRVSTVSFETARSSDLLATCTA